MIWLCFLPFFLHLYDLYHVTLTSDQLKIIIFQFGTPEYHNLGRVHTDHFTRRAYRSRTVRGGLPVYTLRPLRRVRPVH